MSAKKHSQTRLSLTSLLRQRIIESGLPYKHLERETTVKRQTLMAFVKGEQRGMHSDAIEKLLDYFHLELVKKRKAK